MALPPQTVTLYFPSSHLPAVITRLTTYLLQKHYDFLQTFHAASHVDFDIFVQQQSLVHLILRSVEESSPASGTLSPALPHALAADAVALIQHLLQAQSPMADARGTTRSNA